MRSDKNDALAALRKLLAAYDKLDEHDIQRLAESGSDVEIIIHTKKAKEKAPTDHRLDFNFIADKLTNSMSRIAALEFLTQAYESKKTLELIARHLDVPVIKQDKAEILRDKIVEATVGARLRSEAIKGSSSSTQEKRPVRSEAANAVDESDLPYWAGVLNIDVPTLCDAISKVGNLVPSIKEFLAETGRAPQQALPGIEDSDKS